MRVRSKTMRSKQPQFYGAGSKAYKRARDLRQRQTEAESVLWELLRNRKVGNYKFRRQHPIGSFFVDFYCHEALLVIEVDGKIHLRPDVQQYDIERQEFIEARGIKVLRFTNEYVLEQSEQVVKDILQTLKSVIPSAP